jgi:hypothetical protein
MDNSGSRRLGFKTNEAGWFRHGPWPSANKWRGGTNGKHDLSRCLSSPVASVDDPPCNRSIGTIRKRAQEPKIWADVEHPVA